MFIFFIKPIDKPSGKLSASVLDFPAIDAVTAGADFVACCRSARARKSLLAKSECFADSLLVHATVGVLSEKKSYTFMEKYY